MNPNIKTPNLALPQPAESAPAPSVAGANTMPGLPEALESRKTVLATVAGAGAIVLAAKAGLPAEHGKDLAANAPDLGAALGPLAALGKMKLGKKFGEAKQAYKRADTALGKFVVGKVARSPLAAEKKAEKLAAGKRVARTPKTAVGDTVIKAKKTKAKATQAHHEGAAARLRRGNMPRGDRKKARQTRKAEAKSAKAASKASELREERWERRQIAKQVYEATGYNSSASPRTPQQRAFADKLIGMRDKAAVESSEATTKIAVGRFTDEYDRQYALQETGDKVDLDLRTDANGLYINGAYDIHKGHDVHGKEIAVAGTTKKIRVDTSGINGDRISYHGAEKLTSEPGDEQHIMAPNGKVYAISRSERRGRPPKIKVTETHLNGRPTPKYRKGSKAYFQVYGTDLKMIEFDGKGRPVVKPIPTADYDAFKPILRLATDGSDQAYLVSPDTGQRVALSTHTRNGTRPETYSAGGVKMQRTIAFAELPHDTQLDGKPIFLQGEKKVDDAGNKRDYVYVQTGSRARLEPNFFNSDGSIRIDDRGLLLTDDWYDKDRRTERRKKMKVPQAELNGEEKRFQVWKHRVHESRHIYDELRKESEGKTADSLTLRDRALEAETEARAQSRKAKQLNKERRMNRRRVIRKHVDEGKAQAKRGRALDIGIGLRQRQRFDRYQDRADRAAARLERLEIGNVLMQPKTPTERRLVINDLRRKRVVRDVKRQARERKFNPARP